MRTKGQAKLKLKNHNVPPNNRPPSIASQQMDVDTTDTSSRSNSDSRHSASDEESLTNYCLGGFHPVHIGDVYHRRYIVIRKIGFGHFSTVWMCWDFKERRFDALKIMRSNVRYAYMASEEVRMHQKVRKTCVRDRRHGLLVPMWDSFDLSGVNGKHICMVFELVGDNLNTLMGLNREGLALNTVRHIMRQVLLAMDFLHNKCKLIHTDLKPENILTVLLPAEMRAIANDAAEKYLKNYDIDRTMVSRLSFQDLADGKKRSVTGTARATMQRYMNEWNRVFARTSYKYVPHQRKPATFRKTTQKMLKQQEQKLRGEPDQAGPSGAAEKMEVEMADPICHLDPAKEVSPTANPQDRFRSVQTQTDEEGQPGTSCSVAVPVPAEKRMSARGSGDGLEGAFKLLPKQVRSGGDFKVAVKVGDLGNAVKAQYQSPEIVQTREYRAVEVILGCGFDTSVDIWSLGCVAFELATGDFLFDPEADDAHTKDERHLSQIIKFLGPIPEQLLVRCLHSEQFFDDAGQAKFQLERPCPLARLLYTTYSFEAKEAEEFANFLMQMLRLEPRERATAAECLQHPWMTAGQKEAAPSI